MKKRRKYGGGGKIHSSEIEMHVRRSLYNR